MRALRFLNLGILAALVASSAVLYAQDEKQQEDKPRQEEPKRQDQARPESKPNEANRPAQNEAKPARPDQQEQQRQQEAQPRGEMRPAQQEPNRQETARPETGRQESGQQETPRPEERRREPARQETGRQEGRQQQDYARSGGDRGHIPEERFRAEFGREHHFAMHRPEVVDGRPRFEYSGYTFVLVDPWPPAWAYSDDCYIDYVDGEYFLFNTRHPEARLALELVM